MGTHTRAAALHACHSCARRCSAAVLSSALLAMHGRFCQTAGSRARVPCMPLCPAVCHAVLLLPKELSQQEPWLSWKGFSDFSRLLPSWFLRACLLPPCSRPACDCSLCISTGGEGAASRTCCDSCMTFCHDASRWMDANMLQAVGKLVRPIIICGCFMNLISLARTTHGASSTRKPASPCA